MNILNGHRIEAQTNSMVLKFCELIEKLDERKEFLNENPIEIHDDDDSIQVRPMHELNQKLEMLSQEYRQVVKLEMQIKD